MKTALFLGCPSYTNDTSREETGIQWRPARRCSRSPCQRLAPRRTPLEADATRGGSSSCRESGTCAHSPTLLDGRRRTACRGNAIQHIVRSGPCAKRARTPRQPCGLLSGVRSCPGRSSFPFVPPAPPARTLTAVPRQKLCPLSCMRLCSESPCSAITNKQASQILPAQPAPAPRGRVLLAMLHMVGGPAGGSAAPVTKTSGSGSPKLPITFARGMPALDGIVPLPVRDFCPMCRGIHLAEALRGHPRPP